MQNDIFNNIYRPAVSVNQNVALSTNTGTQTTEIETDGSRFVLLTFVGEFGSERTDSVMLFDCKENNLIFMLNSKGNSIITNQTATNISYMYSSATYVYSSKLSVQYNQATSKLIIEMTATTSGSSVITGSVAIKCHTNINGLI